MRNPPRLSVSAVCLVVAALICLSVPPASAETEARITVGRFLVSMAQRLGLESADGAAAEASMRRAGIALPRDLDLERRLTEGDLVTVAAAAGLPVTTTRPAAPVSAGQVDSFFATFGQDFVAGDDGRADTRKHPNPGTDKGKGKKKGHFKSPTDPA